MTDHKQFCYEHIHEYYYESVSYISSSWQTNRQHKRGGSAHHHDLHKKTCPEWVWTPLLELSSCIARIEGVFFNESTWGAVDGVRVARLLNIYYMYCYSERALPMGFLACLLQC